MIEIIRVINKAFSKQLTAAINKIKESSFNESCKNNLCEAGEMLVYSLEMFEKKNPSKVLPLMRNVYDMTLKAIVMDKDEKVLNAYNDIGKKRTEDDDSSSNLRLIIAEDFSKYFSAIQEAEQFKELIGKGFLTQLYDMLCLYSHVTKTNEFVFLIEKEEKLNAGYIDLMTLFVLHPLIMVYFDAVYTKLQDELTVGELYLLYLESITKGLTELNAKYDFNVLKSFSHSFFGKQDDALIERTDKIRTGSLEIISHLLDDEQYDLDADKDLFAFRSKMLEKYFVEEDRKVFD